jgi:hypothetical protein
MKKNDPAPASTACPSDEMFLSAFEGRGTLEAKDALVTHIQTCARCRLKFDVLLQVRTDVAGRWPLRSGVTPVMKRPLVYVTSLAAVVMILLGGLFLFLRKEQARAYRGAGAESLFLIEPSGKLPAPPSKFTWTSVKKAETYMFELVDDELTRITRAYTLRTRFVLPDEDAAKLKRGRTYVWSVFAFDDISRFLDSASRSFEIE